MYFGKFKLQLSGYDASHAQQDKLSVSWKNMCTCIPVWMCQGRRGDNRPAVRNSFKMWFFSGAVREVMNFTQAFEH